MQSKSGKYQKPFRFSQHHELFDRLSSLLVTGVLMYVNCMQTDNRFQLAAMLMTLHLLSHL